MLDRRCSPSALAPAVAPLVAMLMVQAPISASASPLSLRARTVSTGGMAGVSVSDGSAVLGLEGDDAAMANALTAALRKQLAARGKAGARDMTMAELKLTMGCEDTDYACIAEGGKSLAVGELIYGSLQGSAPEYMLSLTVLDVDKARVSNGLQTPITAAQLDASTIDATAAELVIRLLGPAPTTTGPTPTGGGATDSTGGGTATTGEGSGGTDTGTTDATDATDGGTTASSTTDEPSTDDGPKKGRLKAGREIPTPGWKWAGLGISSGLMLGGAGAGVALAVLSGENGPVRQELLDAAAASLEDDKPANDIDPNQPGEDLCALARAEPPNEPGTVTNAAVTKVCNKGESMALGATISFAGAGVFAVSTVVFAVLTFTHREDPAMARLRRHRVRFGVTPQRGGVALGGGFRF